MLCVLYWTTDAEREFINIPFINESLTFVRNGSHLEDKLEDRKDRVDIVIDTIVNNHAHKSIDLNILHRASIEMKGCSRKWEDPEDYHTGLFQDVYGNINIEKNILRTSENFGLETTKSHILDIQEELNESEGMPTSSKDEVAPYSSFRISEIPPNQTSIFRIKFIIQGKSHEQLVNCQGRSSPIYKIYGIAEMENGIELGGLKFFDKSGQYKNLYESSIKNSIIVPQHYNVIAVDYRTNMELTPLIARKQNDCTELDPEFDRQFRGTNGTNYRYFFFQTKDPRTFMIKLMG